MSFYDEVGGHRPSPLVHEFYRGVAEDEPLRALYPEDDLAPAEERLRMFLEQYWGGPTTYSEQRGHPRLRMRHMPYPGDARHARPLAAAHDDCRRLPRAPPEQDDRLRDYLTRAAYSLVNSGGAPETF